MLDAIMSCVVNGTKTSALLGTGAEVSLLSFEWLISEVKIAFDEQHVYELNFYVASIEEPVVIGIDFLSFSCHFRFQQLHLYTEWCDIGIISSCE